MLIVHIFTFKTYRVPAGVRAAVGGSARWVSAGGRAVSAPRGGGPAEPAALGQTEPGDAAGRVPARWGPSPAGPAQVPPQRPAEQDCPAPAPLGPGAAGEAAAGSCPSLAPRAPPAPDATAGPGGTGRARRRSPGRGPGRGAEREPESGSGSGAGALPARLPPGGLDFPPGNAAPAEGNEAAGTAELDWAAEGSGRSTDAPQAPVRRLCGGAEPPGAGGDPSPRCGGSEGWLLVITALRKTRPPERRLH